MRFLSKIRERQFAKKWGGAYNLSRAVLTGVLAAGCLMPGFAEAASFDMAYWKETEEDEYHGLKGEHYTQVGNIANIISFDGINGIADYVDIFWTNEEANEEANEETIVDHCTINVNDVNSPNMTIKPSINISCGDMYNVYAISNTVNISNVTFDNSAVICGGFSAPFGVANYSEDTGSNDTVTGNKVEIKDTTFKKSSKIYGGYSGYPDFGGSVYYSGRTISNSPVTLNTVTIKDTTFNNEANEAKIYGGYTTSNNVAVTDNTVTIEDTMFEKHSFISGGRSDYGEANKNSVNISGGTFSGGKNVDGTLDSHVSGGYSFRTANYNKVIISGGTFNCYVSGGVGANAADGNSVSISGDGIFYREVKGGNSGSGTAKDNRVIISGGTFVDNVYGGWGKGWSIQEISSNSVIISGGTFKDIYGGYIQSNFGTAEGNSVEINGGTINGYVYGGYGETANDNSVIISGGTINGSVYGGHSGAFSDTANNNNKVILVGVHANYPLSAEKTLTGSDHIKINGTVYGSNLHNSTPSNNEIHVYGSKTEVDHIDGFNTLRFFIDNTLTFGETMLTIKGIDNHDTNVTISKDNLAVKVTGKPQASGDKNTITLVHNESNWIEYSNDITLVPVEIGRLLTGEGSVALENDDKDLVLTLNVEKSTVNENGKSLVETRAAAAFVVNNMSDFMLGTGMEQAKAAAGGVTPIDEGKLTPFAAIGGSNMRYTTGSYVDVNGWNGAVGFAKQADKLLFGVAVEHGRGNYDSYLDNGVHASGDIKSTGGVIFGEYKLDNGVHYDAALRAGRVKSDYNSTATSYDESSTYYGFSLGGGKELTVSDKATLDVYGRYYFSHTNGSDVSIATGEEIDFDAVNSHRLRIGGRYTTTLTEKSKAYAGLAWQYEFGGDAKAAINGYSAPTPSLQGHSAIVEAGYKLNAGKNLTLDFNLNGAMGKQRGIGGGIGAQWLF